MEYKFPPYIKLVAILLGIVLTAFVMIAAKSILVPLFISGVLAVLISPLATWLEGKGVHKLLASFLSLIALLSILAGLSIFFYNQIIGLSGDLNFLNQRMSELIGTLNEFIGAHFDTAVPISMDSIQNTIFKYLSENMSTLTQGVIATATTLTIAFILPVYIFLFLYYRKFLTEFIMRAFADEHKEKVQKVVYKVKEVVQNYITGMFFVIIILSVLNSIALYSFGIKHALLFAVFAGMLNVIPFLGPFIGATLPIFYALLTKDSLWYPFGVFMAFYVIQLAESNFFTPKIVGGKVSMNPLMTIIALFVGNFIWGLAGMILFIPGMAMLKVVFDEIPGLEPYGFLLGDLHKHKQEEKMKLGKIAEKVQTRFKKKKG
jgi:predicted PurR-regulated permease PerM